MRPSLVAVAAACPLVPLLLAAPIVFASPVAAHAPPARARPLVCAATTTRDARGAATRGDPRARHAAQRGLEYLARASRAWTEEHRCFGCHVQAVTLEALTIGRHHQYDVASRDLEAMVDALLLGVTAGGRITGAAFEGQAWARYDQWIDGRRTPKLLAYADELLRYQQRDGSIVDDDARKPVTGGTMHTTYQAMQTWRQAYARTADDRWLPPIRRAEGFLGAQSARWAQQGAVYLQDVNLALLGLAAAGVGPAERSSLALQRLLLARQRRDGGWSLDDDRSDAFATGQTLYALKVAGYPDGHPAIARGLGWLIEHQGTDGAWRTVRTGQHGADKGEGMWAVLGLVTVDVMSVAVRGIVDGQHVPDTMAIEIEARDNQEGGVTKVELLVDDLPLAGRCGPRLEHAFDSRGLSEGKHLVDVVATNARGQVSRRRFQVYAGHAYLTDVGTRFDEATQATEITLRSIVPERQAGRVELAVFRVEGPTERPGARVFGREQPAAPGPMTFRFEGAAADGKPLERGRYLAELVLRDAKGALVQRETTPFFHDREEVQRQRFGAIEGQLSLRGGDGLAANTLVELVDDAGQVVQRVRSTEQGNYRFKNVSGGRYKVRVRKDGFTAEEASVSSAPAAAPSRADLSLH